MSQRVNDWVSDSDSYLAFTAACFALAREIYGIPTGIKRINNINDCALMDNIFV